MLRREAEWISLGPVSPTPSPTTRRAPLNSRTPLLRTGVATSTHWRVPLSRSLILHGVELWLELWSSVAVAQMAVRALCTNGGLFMSRQTKIFVERI